MCGDVRFSGTPGDARLKVYCTQSLYHCKVIAHYTLGYMWIYDDLIISECSQTNNKRNMMLFYDVM